MNIELLKKKAKKTRLDTLIATEKAQKGHLGGTFSCIELLVILYYGKVLNFSPQKLSSKKRDTFILSKGHACSAIYSIFLDLGIIDQELYDSYGKNGGLGGQLDTNIPGIDFNTGSLGHSIGVGAGLALAYKKNRSSQKVYTIIGDAEVYEGSIWEGMMFAGENKLNNLICIIDRNRLMVTDSLDDEGLYADFEKKVEAFGWRYVEVDGHNIEKLLNVFSEIKNSNAPTLIMANTIKGKGVSFMENNVKWHHSTPTSEEIQKAKEELS